MTFSTVVVGREPGEGSMGRGIAESPEETDRALTFPAMGGQVQLRVRVRAVDRMRVDRDLGLAASRVITWANRLSRFRPDSDLSTLNAEPDRACVPVRATLATILDSAEELSILTDGLVDITLLDARQAAETGAAAPQGRGRWWLEASGRMTTLRREGTVRFDVGGIGKGWIADRALSLLRRYPSVLVDADGDIALRAGLAEGWRIGVADPRSPSQDLATFAVPEALAAEALGISTSGTSVHRWKDRSGVRHHLIDPRTSRPARTDIVQATVIARSALVAEALAKSVVIAGSDTGLDLLDRAGALAEVVLLETGEVLATPRSLDWLA